MKAVPIEKIIVTYEDRRKQLSKYVHNSEIKYSFDKYISLFEVAAENGFSINISMSEDNKTIYIEFC